VSQYTIYITPVAWREIRDLPGHMRQRVRRAITELADNPRPSESKALVAPQQEDTLSTTEAGPAEAASPLEPPYELRRIRLDRWRIVYTITEADQAIDVIAIRKRPPYDYGDLNALLEQLSS